MATDLEVGMEATGDAVTSMTTEKAAMVAAAEADTAVEAFREATVSRWDDETTEIGAMAAVRRERTTTGHPNDHMKEGTTTIHAKEGTSLWTGELRLFWVGFQPFNSFSARHVPIPLHWKLGR